VCGRYTQERTTAELAEIFDAEPLGEEIGGRYNVAPTQTVAVVVAREGKRRIEAHRWGLIPTWADGVGVGSSLINARVETVDRMPAFRSAFRRRRCIIPADGFYEWRRTGGRAQPFLIRREDGRPMPFAGLWSLWRPDEDTPWLLSCAIVTTAADETIKPLHDRMPVSLDPRAWDTWLDPGVSDVTRLRSLLEPDPGVRLTLREVSTRVNDVANEGPDLVVPIEAAPVLTLWG
jgi:putative SOS response-associated peptidase YedK